MKRKITITYTWWNNTAGDPLPEHVEELEDCAWEHITRMLNAGFTSGELICEEEGYDYRGYWDIAYNLND